MKCSRRDLGLLIPSLVALGATALNTQPASAQAAAADSVEKLPVIKTQHFKYGEIPVTTNGKNKQRRMFTAKTHTGFKIESHQSEIAPGEVNHPPHQHLREEKHAHAVVVVSNITRQYYAASRAVDPAAGA